MAGEERARLKAARRAVPTVSVWNNEWLSQNRLAKDIADLSLELTGGRLLDVGCGNKPYRKCFPQVGEYWGIDVALESSADVASLAMPLPFSSCSFDGALCTQVLEHVETPAVLIQELARVLRPNGQLLLSAPMYWRHHEEPYDFYRFTRHGLTLLLTEGGFEIKRLLQQGGAWRVVGQAMANTFLASVRFRTFGARAAVLAMINMTFSALDRVNYQSEDTCNFVVLACKRKEPL